MSVIIKSGAASDLWSIDATSKAGRVTPYDTLGNNRGVKATYRAATTAPFAAASGTGPFFAMAGSASKTIIVQRLVVSQLTLTAVTFVGVVCQKCSTAATGGTAVALVQVPLDANNGAATAALCSVYTAAPTTGTVIGTIGADRVMAQTATAVATSATHPPIVFDFRTMGSENSGVYLRNNAQSIQLAFAAAPGSATSMSLQVEWVEE